MKPYYDADGIQIYHGDCREVLPQLEKVDACLTSPPYNARKSYACDKWPSWDDYYAFLQEVYGAVKATRQGWVLPFSMNDADTGLLRVPWSECQIPWKRVRLILRHPDVDDSKSLIAFPPRAEVLCLDDWVEENGAKIWYVPHAKFAVTKGRSMSNGHPAAFHEKMVSEFVKMFPSVTSLVDPFSGTGTTVWVAKKMGLRAIGVEISEQFCEMAALRLSQKVLLTA